MCKHTAYYNYSIRATFQSKLLTLFRVKLQRLRKELQDDHDRKLREMQDTTRRSTTDATHQVELERLKFNQLQDDKLRLQQQVRKINNKQRQNEVLMV